MSRRRGSARSCELNPAATTNQAGGRAGGASRRGPGVLSTLGKTRCGGPTIPFPMQPRKLFYAFGA
eukprot:7087126-Alexandrium_andersonii.AAC.1